MMRSILRNFRVLSFLASVLLALWACHLGTEEKTEEVFTFATLPDSLKASDRARILLVAPSGDTLDVLFDGPVTPEARFEGLVARRYDGGQVTIVVEGYKEGTLNYKMEKAYDGASGKVDGTVIVVARPVAGARVDSVGISPDTLRVTAHGPLGLFVATVHPDTLSQAVTWKSLEAAIATVSPEGKVSGRQAGEARMVATSALDGRTSDTAVVIVAAAPKVESVKFDRARLEIYLGGSAEPLVVQVLPDGANPDIEFQIADSTVVEILDGRVKGLKEDRTTVTVRSREDTSLSATLEVVVLPRPSDPVDSVAVSPDTLRLFTGGESRSLLAAIHPRTLPARFSWRSASPAVAVVDTSGKVSPVAQGRTFVSATSLADSTRRDSTLVIVKKDSPRIQIGGDTTISVGQTLSYLPIITQEYGLTTMVRWDLDGDGAWDDSAANPRTVSYRYAEAKEYQTRFSARDTEGNDTTVTRKVRSVNGPVILFTGPVDGSYTNQSPITVTWSVDGVPQASTEALVPGPNTITRTAQDGAGETYSVSITVHYDTVPPARPLVKGPSGPVTTLRPAWSWEPAGGGNGTFRFRLDNDNFTVGATVVADTSFTPGANLDGGPHTLYVQERDQAGNWSPTGSFTVLIDTTPPAPPAVTVSPASPTNNRRPTWSWSTRGGGRGTWRFKLGDRNMSVGATVTTVASHTPSADLPAGLHTLHVQERDSAGNWSATDSASVLIDISAPGAPQVTVSPASPTRDQTPTWSWRSGSAATGSFRYKLGDPNLNAGAVETRDTNFTPPADLAAGSWVLYVQERNAAGTWSSSGSATVRIDTTRPQAPAVSVSPSSPTNDRRPTWSWNKREAGIGFFRYRINNGAMQDTTSTSFRPSAAGQLAEGIHTVYVQEGDSAGNWSAEGSAQIRIDYTPPTAPTVNGPASPTNDDTPTWTWVAGTGGNGSFRFRLNDTNMTGGTATTQLTYTPPALAPGSHTLHVQERDSAGNWSARGSHTLVIDRTPPSAPNMNTTTPRSPLNTLRPTWTWTSGGGGNGTYQVKIGDGNFSTGAITISGTTYTPPANLAQGAQTLYVRERDAAQNWSAAASRSIFLAPRDTLGTLGGSGSPILVTSSGIVYAVFGDPDVQSFSVKRYNPGTDLWDVAGTGFFLSNIQEFALDPTDIPYVVGYSNWGVHVQRLVGTVWQDVGTVEENATRLGGSYHSLGFTSQGTPLMALVAHAESSPYSIALMRFAGTRWEYAKSTKVGTEPWYVDLAVGGNDRPYIGYQDLSGAGAMGNYVVTTDPFNYLSKWDTVGSGSAYNSNGSISGLKVKCHSNQIYLGVVSSAGGVQILSSSGGGFTPSHSAPGSDFDLAVNSAGVPYYAFVRPDAPYNQITVRGRFNSTWISVGAVLQRSGGMFQPSLAVTGDGVPYVGFFDEGAGGKISVIRTSFDP